MISLKKKTVHVATFQLIAALEIVHAAIGIVGGSPMMSLMQWAGRSNILWGIVRSIPEVQNSLYVGAMLLAWSLSEVIRYPWYAASTLQMCPQWLTWLRYTAFIPLYPIGVIGEMMSAFKALDLLKERGLHSFSMPNFFNMSFDYRGFMICVLCAYPFLWWQLYSTLLRQRAKKLSLSKRNKTD